VLLAELSREDRERPADDVFHLHAGSCKAGDSQKSHCGDRTCT
jgi:hypothetical protein